LSPVSRCRVLLCSIDRPVIARCHHPSSGFTTANELPASNIDTAGSISQIAGRLGGSLIAGVGCARVLRITADLAAAPRASRQWATAPR
jgi:hypothetical protein